MGIYEKIKSNKIIPIMTYKILDNKNEIILIINFIPNLINKTKSINNSIKITVPTVIILSI